MNLATDAPFVPQCERASARFALTLGGDAVPLELREAQGSERAQTEHFIAERYRRNFGARIEAFMPRLFALRATGDEGQCIEGALGLRSAQGRLFVEQYLDAPIERAILAATGERVDRASIVEVGHFAGLHPGAMRTMIVLLADRLQREGIGWVAFTGTRALYNAFRRMRLRPRALCVASPDRLAPKARAAWGTYYGNDPWVYVGPVRNSIGISPSRSRTSGEHDE
jgi:hypothetical protein